MGAAIRRGTALLALVCLVASGSGRSAADGFAEAERNGEQARRALVVANTFLSDWASRLQADALLVPDPGHRSVWTVRFATRLHPLLAGAAYLTDRKLLQGLVSAIPAQEESTVSRLLRLPDDYDLSSGRHATSSADPERIALSSAAYVHLGLAPIAEMAGAGPWADRLKAIVDDMFTLATVTTPFADGPLPSSRAEINGHLLCVLPGLAARTGDDHYLALARRIGDAYCKGVLPANRGLPASVWNFDANRAVNAGISLDNTGWPIISGLVGLFSVETALGTDRRHVYGPPLAQMLNVLFRNAATPEAHFYARIEPDRRKGYTVDRKNRTADWPRLLEAAVICGRLTGNDTYAEVAARALIALPETYEKVWRGRPERLLGSLPGVLNLLHRLGDAGRGPSRPVSAWLDEQMANLLTGDTGPRNQLDPIALTRAALAYAWYKSSGMHTVPWAPDLQFGASTAGDSTFIALESTTAWDGRLTFDTRLSIAGSRQPVPFQAYPIRFGVEPQTDYGIRIEGAGGQAIWAGSLLSDGLRVPLKPDRVIRIQIWPEATAADTVVTDTLHTPGIP